MNQIPITLQSAPTNIGVAPANFNQLLALVAGNLTAFISADVSFFAQGTVIPSTFVSSLFFNVSNGYFYYWDTGSGSYLPITPFIQGDCKSTFIAGDNVNLGWIQCDGRAVTAVVGISARQLAVLQSLFGVTGNLPTIAPLQSIVGLPGTGAFSGILNPAVSPASGQFSGLTVNSPPQQADIQAITANCESLDESASATQQAVAAVIVQAEAVLDALNGAGGPTLYVAVYIGPP